ncbi:ABC transporter permease subunit [Vibrio sp. PP-XX7]
MPPRHLPAASPRTYFLASYPAQCDRTDHQFACRQYQLAHRRLGGHRIRFRPAGLGRLLVKAIFSRDYMVVEGVVLLFAVATVLVNLLADILTVFIDARIKL